MGTRGYAVFRYKGIYYIFYNNSDSYPEWLGGQIIREFNRLTAAQLELLRSLITDIPMQQEFGEGDRHFQGILTSAQHSDCVQYMTTEQEPSCTVFIEYVYILDFDQDIFTVKSYSGDSAYSFATVRDQGVEIFSCLNDEDEE